MDESDLRAHLALLLTPGWGATLTRRCVDQFGCAAAVLLASPPQLAQVQGVGETRAQTLHQSLAATQAQGLIDRELHRMAQLNARMVTLGCEDYPKLLRLIPDPPPALLVRGRLQPEDAVALGVVGSRRCTGYGREQADRFASLAVASGLCVVSGGALGIDAAAHRAALRAGGRTIAVLGSGLAQPYPPQNVPLFDQIVAEDRGALLSELPITAPPRAENFPPRNRIISGLSLGVLVIEAALRSGALITARLAAEDHGREVMALPGRVDSAASAGCHQILREGWASLVTSIADVLESLGETGQLLKAHPPPSASLPRPTIHEHHLTPSQRKIVQLLEQPRSLDELIEETALPVHCVQADLTLLQVRGLLRKSTQGFERCR